MEFTPQELKAIASLIGLAPITGKEAPGVAMLLQKISSMLTPKPQLGAATLKAKKDKEDAKEKTPE